MLARSGETRVDGRASLASAAPRPHQWDGAMINTILIVLVAVVVLIVVIAVLALHFLRADDSDNFDEIPDEPRRSPRSPADAPPSPRELVPAGAERGRPRRSAPAREPWPAERPVRAGDDRASTYRERDTGPRPAVAERRDSKPAAKRAAATGLRSRRGQPTRIRSRAAGIRCLTSTTGPSCLSTSLRSPRPPPQQRPLCPQRQLARPGGAQMSDQTHGRREMPGRRCATRLARCRDASDHSPPAALPRRRLVIRRQLPSPSS